MLNGKRYLRLCSKGLLILGYIFLFAVKFNNRFFTLANFFEYRPIDKAMTAHTNCPFWLNAPDHKSHLGVDKRYSINNFVKLPYTVFTVAASYETLARVLFVPLKVYSSAYLSTNALRGPPCA